MGSGIATLGGNEVAVAAGAIVYVPRGGVAWAPQRWDGDARHERDLLAAQDRVDFMSQLGLGHEARELVCQSEAGRHALTFGHGRP